ncbi:amino acid racemase, partial [Patescibacteria group bacterium]|nr:amino acid racemase [Patescibacteria group bacterium]
MSNAHKTIGILGGMGPAASANMYQKLLAYAQYQYGAVQDDEYPPVILYSLPLSGFDETGIVDGAAVTRQLIAGVETLERAGCDCIIIACNTVHVYLPQMQAAVSIPILSIVEQARLEVVAYGYTRVGLFASASTVRLGLYEQALSADGISVLSPSPEQQLVMNHVIERVMGGVQNDEDVVRLKEIALAYTAQGAQAMVLGCTEI